MREVDEQGATPLHHAAGAGAAAIVARLLARGADPEARDSLGATPGDRARGLWQERRAASLAVLALLPPPRPSGVAEAPAAAIAVGERVTHERFGVGVVEACEGEGAACKLRVQFADGARTLLARFVRRGG